MNLELTDEERDAHAEAESRLPEIPSAPKRGKMSQRRWSRLPAVANP
jgi:hypothetical protein